MSIDNASPAAAAKQVLTPEERAMRASRPSTSQPVFNFPELNPRFRQSTHAGKQMDVATTVENLRERANADGITQNPPMHTDSRQAKVGESKRHAEPQPKKTASKAQLGQTATSPRNSSSAEGTQKSSGINVTEKTLATAQQEKLADKTVSKMQSLVTNSQEVLDEKTINIEQTTDLKQVSQNNPLIGTHTATNAVTMQKAPQQLQPSSRTSFEGAQRALAGLEQGTVANRTFSVVENSAQTTSQQKSNSREQSSSDDRQDDARLRSTSTENDTNAPSAPTTDRVAAFQIEGGTPQPATASQSTNNVAIVTNIMRQIEQMREQGRTALQVNIPLPDGQEIRLTLRMTENRVQVKIDAPNQEISDTIEDGWADLTRKATRAGIRLESPLFADHTEQETASQLFAQTA